MSRILRFLMCLFCIVFIGDAVFAAGYECPTYRQYTTCNKGYYLAYSYSGTSGSNLRHDPTPRPGNACRPCSDYDAYKKVAKGSHTCAGGTAGPVLNTVTITYNLNGGSGTTPDSESCKKEETCTLNDGATTSFYRAGYVFKGWALTRTATSGFTSYTFTGSDTVYAVWEECGIGKYKPGSGTQAAAACSSCPELTPRFDYVPTTGNTSLTACRQGIAKAEDVNGYCATSSGTTEQFDIECNAASDGTWNDCVIGNAWTAKPGSYVGIWKQEMPAEDVIENMCIQCTDGTYSEGGLINSCSLCPELNPMDEQAGWRVSSGGDGATSWNACYAYWERFPSNCASGSFKKNAISEIDYEQAWHELEPLKAKPGYMVQFEDGQTTAPACVACTDATFSPGGDVHSCSACPPGYDDNTETGKTSAAECQISCDDGTYVKTANAACTAVGSGYYKAAHMVNYGSTSTRDQCPSGYPNSDVGAAVITSCYSNTQSRPWSGGMVNGDVPTNCSEVTEWGTCSKSACEYVAYSNSAGTADGTVMSGCKDNSEDCVRPVVAVAAKSGYYDAGTTCSACPDGYPNSENGNEGGNTKCYASVSGGHYIGTRYSATQSECVGGTYKAAHTVYYGSTSSCAVCGTNQYSDDGAASCTACKTSAGYGNSGTTASSHDGVASCKVTCDAGEYVPTAGGGCVAVGSGYYKTGTMTVAQNATNTTRSACSSLPGVSVSGGTYSSVSPYNASTTCRYKAPNKTITGCAAVTTATVAYSGSAWSTTTYTVSASPGYYISNSGTASATCVGCQAGYACTGGTAARDACDGQTQYQDTAKQTSCKTVSSGWYKVDNTKQAQCTGATYCSSGVQNSCPAQTSGWTRNGGTGWTSYTQCNQTRAATSVSSYCSAGQLKQTATSATEWGASTISTAFQAKAGAYVNGQTCSQCTADNYCTGGTAAPTDCPSGYPNSAAGSDAITDCYSNTKSRPWTGSQNACTKPSGCSTVTCNSCSKSACNYVAYANTAGTGDGTVKSGCSTNNESCNQTVKSVTANPGYKVNGTACTICTGATYSAGGAATSCSNCPTIYTDNTASGKKAATECQVVTDGGYYIAANNDDAQTICGVRNYCPSATVNYGSHNSPIACPTASEHLRTTYPDNYYNPTSATATNQTWGDGKDAITDCKAVYMITNARGRFTVESTGYNAETEKYDVGGTKYYTKVNPGYYVKDRLASTYCNDTSRPMYYTDAQPCPAGSYCPGLSSMPSCSSGEYTETNGINSCPANYGNSPAMSDAATDCYLTTTAKNFVATPNAAQTTCTAGGYCVGGVKVNYGSTGGRTPASKGYYVSTTGATTQTPCAAGTYTSSTGQTKCTDAAAGTYTTGCQITSNNTACTGTAVCATNKYSDARASVCIACNTADGYGNSGTTAASHAGQASCKVTCGGGEYVPTAGGGCVNVGVGYWGAGGTVSETSTLARSQCESGLTTIGSGAGADEAGDCGRVLNVNGEKIYLRSTKKTTPSLNVSINGDVFYGNMGASGIGALKLKSNGTTYSVYDDSMQ